LVLRVDTCCGFVTPDTTLRAIPWFSLLGDGAVVTEGPQIEIYPGPALPNIQEANATDEAIRRILAAARDAGLFESHDYTEPTTISDAATTIFTLVEADGTRHVTRAYALMESDDSSLSSGDREARARLRHFVDQLGRLREWLPRGSMGDDHPYRFDELRVYAQELRPEDAANGPEEPVEHWPLNRPLATFGDTSDRYAGWRCGVVGGGDLDTLRPHAGRSNELTPWESGGANYRLLFRPLLPDEHSC
jgi:hypothetical protein